MSRVQKNAQLFSLYINIVDTTFLTFEDMCLMKGVRTPIFLLIICLPCFDPFVLFCCLVFRSISSSTERG